VGEIDENGVHRGIVHESRIDAWEGRTQALAQLEHQAGSQLLACFVIPAKHPLVERLQLTRLRRANATATPGRQVDPSHDALPAGTRPAWTHRAPSWTDSDLVDRGARIDEAEDRQRETAGLTRLGQVDAAHLSTDGKRFVKRCNRGVQEPCN
jgi:hypothetical protein